MDVAVQLELLERQLLQPEVRGQRDAVAALLTEEFREFGSSGRCFTKAEIVAALAQEQPLSMTLTDFTCTPLADDVALVTYVAVKQDAGRSLRSSIWVMRAGRWQMLFHQGTRVAA